MKLVEGGVPIKFLSTPSARRATPRPAPACAGRLDFYPRPPRGGRHVDDEPSAAPVAISIHALREEGDCSVDDTFDRSIFISIHALREEGDAGHCGRCGGAAVISIHALREEGDQNLISSPAKITISIHALREEGDRGCRVFAARHMPFLSTPSVRRATITQGVYNHIENISIHALREEGDHLHRVARFQAHISIHALREEGDMPAREREVSCW